MSNFIRIEIEYDENLVTPRSHNRIMNRIYREEMRQHKDKILPRHFEEVPETRPHGAYGYAPRSKRWQKRKEREGRGQRPLVYKGLMRTIVTRESVVRATKDHGTLTAKNYYDMTDGRRHEVEAISDREIDRMVARIKRRYIELASSPEFARKRAPKRLKVS